MAFSSSRTSSLSFFSISIIITIIIMSVDSQPLPQRSNSQIIHDLFGPEIGTLLLAQSEITEGSADSPGFSLKKGHDLHGRSHGMESHNTVPRLFLDFLSRQRKFRGRSRKSAARGCFGMKVDRIGVISGLGC